MEKTYNRYNFHKNTFCVFKKVDFSLIKDCKIDYKSKSGSSYVYTEKGVYRIANHWGRASDCRWRLSGDHQYKNQFFSVGYADWTDFYENDEVSKLFFVEIDYGNKKATFHHRKSPLYNESYCLRTANETSKTIKIIQQVLTDDAWAKYLDYDDLDTLRVTFCSLLQNSNQSFIDIKKMYLKK
jgi:hypothetical protein